MNSAPIRPFSGQWLPAPVASPAAKEPTPAYAVSAFAFSVGISLLVVREMVNQVPKHVAIIMDGNGRWARQRGWPRSRGHLEGAKAVKACVEACLELGVLYLTLYAFSTENWQRPKEEVDTLMGLLRRFLRDYTKDLARRGVRVQAIGRLNELPPECQEQLEPAITTTANSKQLTAILA